MSLYNHVRDKDDVLCEVVDRLLASVWQPQAEEADWWKWISEAADRLHTFLVSEPAALHVYLKQPVVSPVALQRMETVLGVLQKSGLNEEEARRAYAAIHTYTVGFSALESSRSHWVPPDDAPELAMQLAGFVSPHQFTSGLRYMLEAIEQRSSSAEGRWLST
jgi:AcrR family transcriptional regulator